MLRFSHRSFACGCHNLRCTDCADRIVRRTIGRREETGLLHLGDAFFESPHDLFDVGDAMRRRQECWKAFKDVNPLRTHEVVEETGEALFRREAEIEDASKSLNPSWH